MLLKNKKAVNETWHHHHHHSIDGIFKMNKSSRKEGSVNPDKKS